MARPESLVGSLIVVVLKHAYYILCVSLCGLEPGEISYYFYRIKS